ncbi:hypothetical protein ROHU_002135 [Labeo rohita]|uniref:Uncharacterized protein n=1 Tax=Labeo rohita TaxID=84645 RepID=A0A498NTN7_LABRO|nr:hypothetical protein ROHU_014323 [Labeo rohita]RXN37383.1 hypothetical protein ROHU_002135 [Labeo rohita]
MSTLVTARTVTHNGIAGGKSHDREHSDATMETSGGDNDDGAGAHDANRNPKEWRDAEDLRGCNGAAATNG